VHRRTVPWSARQILHQRAKVETANVWPLLSRHLLYVACTRARDRLLVTGVEPASEFLDDLQADSDARPRHVRV